MFGGMVVEVVFCFLRMVKEEVSDKVTFEEILVEDERVSLVESVGQSPSVPDLGPYLDSKNSYVVSHCLRRIRVSHGDSSQR